MSHARNRWIGPSAATAILSVLALAGCGASRDRATSRSARNRLAVSSTLDGLSKLPSRIHWVATPRGRAPIAEVDFLIDGRLAWVENNAPYYYGDDGNWLVTSFLTPGIHVFTVHVQTLGGKSATDIVRASVTRSPAPPASLHGTWERNVTGADIQKSTSGEPPPSGIWRLRIVAQGWRLKDPSPTSSYGLFDVQYPAADRLQLRPTIEYPPYPNGNKGGFCGDTDPLWTWSYSTAGSGDTLELRPVGHDPCGDRAAVLLGIWHRVRK